MHVMLEELTTREAAEAARVNVKTIYRWMQEGLAAHRPKGTGHYRIYRDDLDTFLQRRQAHNHNSVRQMEQSK